MTVPTIAQNAPYVWAVLGGSNVGIPTIAQDAPYVWTLAADANGNAVTENYFFNIVDYGAIQGDNNTNKVVNTTAITNAITAALVNGGVVFFPPGTWRSKNVDTTNVTGVVFMGAGIGVSIWKLADGENTNLFSGYAANINLSATLNTGPNTGISNFGFKDITLDGNKAGQASGTSYCMQFYGYGDFVENIEIRNGYSGGVQRDYYGSSNPYNTQRRSPRWHNYVIHDCNNIGIEIGGPTDQIHSDFEVMGGTGATHGMHVCPNAGGLLGVNGHNWYAGVIYGRLPFFIEGACSFLNCEAEGGDTVQIALHSPSVIWKGGSVFATAHNGAGIQIGQVSLPTLTLAKSTTPFAATIQPNTFALACYAQFVVTGAAIAGSLDIVGTDYSGNASSENLPISGNGTFVSVNPYATITSVTVNGLTGFSIVTNGLPLPYAGAIKQSGGFTTGVPAADYVIDTYFHDIPSSNASLWFCNDSIGQISGHVKQTSGFNYFTGTPALVTQMNLNCTGAASRTSVTRLYYPSATVNSSLASGGGSGGTIATLTANIARVNPSANVTGAILQAGIISGQILMVENQSAFWIQMATSGTSNVATGTSDYIAPNAGAKYEYNTTTALWYRVNPPYGTPPIVVNTPGAEHAVSATAVVAGSAYATLVQILAPVTITQMRSWFSGAPTGNVDMGIYDTTGTNSGPGSRLASTGVNAASAGVFTKNLSANYVAFPGVYWLAFLDTVADTVACRTPNGIGMGALVKTSATNLTSLGTSFGAFADVAFEVQLFGLVSGGYS